MKRLAFGLLILTIPMHGISRAALGPHDVTATTGSGEGSCAECHNVAATASARGWGRSTEGAPTTGWFSQPITILCWTCHSSGNAAGAHDVSATAMNLNNHSYVNANAPPGATNPYVHDNLSITNSRLPYVSGGALQCTSCHNVHNAQYRPFLAKQGVTQLCSSCHPRRNTNGIRTANIGVGIDNVSMHPVEIQPVDLTGGSAGIKPVAQIDPALKTGLNADNTWKLGGKLSDAGNITCGTCHAVHGPSGGASAVNDLLAIDNKAGDSATQNSPLCAGCHYGGTAGGAAGGTGTFDHPFDNNAGIPFYPAGVTLPYEWTITPPQPPPRLDRGASAFNSNGTPRCSSCHDAHGGRGGTSLLYGPLPPKAANGDWCLSCHHAAPNAHHSAQGLESGFVSAVVCESCHERGGSAHNHPVGYFTSFVQATVPANFTTARGRAVSKADVGSNAGSALCLYCHRDDDPLRWRAVYGHADNEAMNPMPVVNGTKRGGGSHYLGARTVPGWGIVLKADSWAADNAIYSKYRNASGGGNTPPDNNAAGAEVICESCHNVLYNDGAIHPSDYPDAMTAGWRANLLLKPYADDGSGTGGAGGSTGSGLCAGCHWKMGYAHPLTGDTVSRTGSTLKTGSGSLADQTNAPIGGGSAPGTLSFPDTNKVDCDSCHRPHSADSDSTVPPGTVLADHTVLGRQGHLLLEVDDPGNNWGGSLCLECHSK